MGGPPGHRDDAGAGHLPALPVHHLLPHGDERQKLTTQAPVVEPGHPDTRAGLPVVPDLLRGLRRDHAAGQHPGRLHELRGYPHNSRVAQHAGQVVHESRDADTWIIDARHDPRHRVLGPSHVVDVVEHSSHLLCCSHDQHLPLELLPARDAADCSQRWQDTDIGDTRYTRRFSHRGSTGHMCRHQQLLPRQVLGHPHDRLFRHRAGDDGELPAVQGLPQRRAQ